MNRVARSAALAGLAIALSSPLLAQPASAPAKPASQSSQTLYLTGTVQKAQNRWRSSTIVGATVRNEAGRGIGRVRDLLLDDNGEIQTALITVGGLRNKVVAVPFGQLKFVPAQAGSLGSSPELGAALTPSSKVAVYTIILPGATRDSLRGLENFNFGS